jgi:hypothetical protein
VIGGFGSGHIRLFNAQSGEPCAEVAAHARWINAMDLATGSGMVRLDFLLPISLQCSQAITKYGCLSPP